jgi:methylated-DNA-[protein]-cysteine S-methyltransferase
VTRVPYAAGGWGIGELWLDGPRLVWHELPRPRSEEPREAGEPLVRRVRDFFAGRPVGFGDVEIDTDGWTAFQLDVAAAIREVEYGDVVSYAELARLAGYPRAQRAVGTFCAGNRYPLVLPCHRVVAAGGIGSFGSLGVEYKRRLLQLEGVSL